MSMSNAIAYTIPSFRISNGGRGSSRGIGGVCSVAVVTKHLPYKRPLRSVPRPSRRSTVGMHHLIRVIARANERPSDHLLESQFAGERSNFIELGGRDESGHRDVFQRRGEILAERQNVATH